MSEKTGTKLKGCKNKITSGPTCFRRVLFQQSLKASITLNVCCLLVAVTSTPAHASGINGRISVSGSIANPDSGDLITTDQQTLRLMHEGVYNQNEWTIHLKTTRRHQQNTGAERPPCQ